MLFTIIKSPACKAEEISEKKQPVNLWIKRRFLCLHQLFENWRTGRMLIECTRMAATILAAIAELEKRRFSNLNHKYSVRLIADDLVTHLLFSRARAFICFD